MELQFVFFNLQVSITRKEKTSWTYVNKYNLDFKTFPQTELYGTKYIHPDYLKL